MGFSAKRPYAHTTYPLNPSPSHPATNNPVPTPGATASVFLAGQWICPDLFLRRPAHRHPLARLDRLLDMKAKEARAWLGVCLCLCLCLCLCVRWGWSPLVVWLCVCEVGEGAGCLSVTV